MAKRKPRKSTTWRSYVFGDFDKDGIANIDDMYPFDKRKGRFPYHNKKPLYFHKARWGSGEREITLSQALRNLERDLNAYRSSLRAFLRRNPTAFGRIKTIPSVIDKLRKRYLKQLSDIIGTTIVTGDRAQAKRLMNFIKKNYRVDARYSDDYYKKPLKGSYYAYHLGLIGKDKRRIELQIKSLKMFALHKKMHRAHKHGNRAKLRKYKKKARELYRRGY